VTAEVTVHHLTLTHEACREGGPNTKMKPPLRTGSDVEACRRGVADGTIDCICTDHAPHTTEAKSKGLAAAPFGIAGVETAWALACRAMLDKQHFHLSDLVARMSLGPAAVLGLADRGRLSAGSAADVVLVDPEVDWTVNASSFLSKGRNTPFDGWRLRGRPIATMLGGRWSYMSEFAKARLQ
jgi:dihydroorotase